MPHIMQLTAVPPPSMQRCLWTTQHHRSICSAIAYVSPISSQQPHNVLLISCQIAEAAENSSPLSRRIQQCAHKTKYAGAQKRKPPCHSAIFSCTDGWLRTQYSIYLKHLKCPECTKDAPAHVRYKRIPSQMVNNGRLAAGTRRQRGPRARLAGHADTKASQ